LAFSLLEFRALPFSWPRPADWLFFYSRRGAHFFAVNHRPLPGQQIAAMGPGTASQLNAEGLRVDFTGSGRPEEVAEAFAEEARGQRVLFLQARRSRQSVQRLLQHLLEAQSVVVYDNRPRAHWVDPQAEVLVFTSPLNAETYLGRLPPREGQQWVALGDSTAELLRQQGLDPWQPESPSEEALLKLLVQQVLPLTKKDL
jgi:uroporphyrinogen-III synthase